jgi:hypothetical protein
MFLSFNAIIIVMKQNYIVKNGYYYDLNQIDNRTFKTAINKFKNNKNIPFDGLKNK